MKRFICLMEDNSMFRMPDPEWNRALGMKYPVRKWAKIKKVFREDVAKHFQARTVPTKFNWDEPWENEYKNHAELAKEVMYVHIRAPLMGIILAEATEGKSKVIALSRNEQGKATIYSDKKPKKTTIEEAFP